MNDCPAYVYCSQIGAELDLWSTGTLKTQGSRKDFSQARYEGLYRKHIKQIEQYGKTRPDKFLKMRKKLYAQLR